MEREGDLGNYLRFNFENAIEIIDKLEVAESKLNKPTIIPREPIRSRFTQVSEEANAAMKRFTTKLRKELKDAKSK